MNGTAHAGLGVLALAFVWGVFLVRYAVTGGQSEPRERSPQPVEEWEPAYLWLPAQQLAADCPGCGHQITIHTTTGDHR